MISRLSCTLTFVVALSVILSMAPASASADSASPHRPTQIKASPESCALLDEPSIRGRMDGLLLKLLISCGRENELGQVWQQTEMEAGFDRSAADVQVNDSSGDTTGSHTQSETSIAVNPTTGTICSGYNDSFHGVEQGAGYTGFSSSSDGGASFVDHGALSSSSFGDPSIVWRKSDGNFFFAALHSNGLGIWHSTDDCQTFPYLANSHSGSQDDKEILAVDNDSASPYYGRLYVGWTDFTTARIYVNYSDDGSTWSTPVAVSGSGVDVQGAWPAIAPNGDVFVGWVRWNPYSTGPIDIEIVRSTDGGATFSPVTNPMTGKVNPRDSSATSNCGRPALNGNIRYLPSPQLAVGPDGTLHVVYSYDPDTTGSGDVVNVYYRRSTDSGATWDTEVQINDDATTRDQFFPSLTVSQTNQVAVSYYDRRLDTNNLLIDYYQSISFDGGATWEASERISDVSTPVFLDPDLATCYHGDYDQSHASDTAVLTQWSDDRNVQDAHNDPDVYLDQTPLSVDFLVLGSPASQSICAGDSAAYTIDVPQFQGFTDDVTLAVSGEPAGTTTGFTINPVTPPGTSDLSISNTGGAVAGSYSLLVTGTSSPGAIVHDTTLGLELFDATPTAPTLVAPGDGAVDVGLLPVLSWTASTQGVDYLVEVATDPGFSNLVESATVTALEHQLASVLDPISVYFWRVTSSNPCGSGTSSAAFSFTTRAIPPILLVDDDDNGPDVRATYESALTNLGWSFDVWDTANSDDEPTAPELAPYDLVVWFTGDEFGGSAGPGSAGETALATWLDAGAHCLFVSSQDYHYDRGATPFMQSYLGLGSATNDTDQNTVTGAGSAFSGLGPYALSYPFTDFSDTVVAGAGAEVAFVGDVGNAALNFDGGVFHTVFFAFPWEAVPSDAEREEVLSRVFELCNQSMFSDGFESGDTTHWDVTAP